MVNSTRRPPRRGLSLIEVVLTAALLATIALIALPRFGNAADRRRVETAARKLLADLEWCRQLARASELPASLTLHTSGTPGWTLSGANTPPVTLQLATSPFHTTFDAVNLLTAANQPVAQIDFDRLGRPSATGTVRLRSGSITVDVHIEGDAAALRIVR